MSPRLAIAAAVALLMILAAAGAAVQTYRLRAANVELEMLKADLSGAIALNGDMAALLERAAQAQREHDAALALLRRNYERRLADARKIPDDGCLDRALPDAVRRLLTESDPADLVAACPAGT